MTSGSFAWSVRATSCWPLSVGEATSRSPTSKPSRPVLSVHLCQFYVTPTTAAAVASGHSRLMREWPDLASLAIHLVNLERRDLVVSGRLIAPFSNANHSPLGSALIGSTSPSNAHRSLKWLCEADRSFCSVWRQLAIISCGVMPALGGRWRAARQVLSYTGAIWHGKDMPALTPCPTLSVAASPAQMGASLAHASFHI